ncbi:MAG TPA: glycosyltransferase family 4 protein [Solirubrobacteraceae bacterium]|nr:glycosyltransferase family 4 protein [Solirubrobacteraceae bacterium]
MSHMAGRRMGEHKQRLLILTPDFSPEYGGVQALAAGLARALSGFRTEVVTPFHQAAAGFDVDSGIATRRVGGSVAPQQARVLALNMAAVRHALRVRPHVTLSVHAVCSPAATAIRRLLGARTGQYFHANEILHRPRLCAFAAGRANVVVAVSSYTASLLAQAGATPASLQVIPPGIDLPADAVPLPAERPTVLTIAQLKHRYKGHGVLIRALPEVSRHVPSVEWVVIGDGPLREELEARARSAGLGERARFLGAVRDSERNSWLRRADVFAMPSGLPGEGFGIAYLEASAYAKPIVAGNVGGSPEAVLDGVSGLLVDPTDPTAVADALTRLLLDRELAHRLGDQGAARARGFAWPVIARRVEAALLGSTAIA